MTPLEFLYGRPERALPALCLIAAVILGVAFHSIRMAVGSACLLLGTWYYWSARLVILDQRLGPVRIRCPKPDAVWLTFDDGPGPETLEIVQTLNRFGCSATFFFIGEQVEGYQRLSELEAALREGRHSVANHSRTHPSFLPLDREAAVAQIESAQTLLEAHFSGILLPMFRPPFGYRTRQTMLAAEDRGFEVVGWSLNSLDFLDGCPRRLAGRVRERIGEGEIVLFHDGRSNRTVTAKALPLLLEWLKATGYQTYNPLDDVDPSQHH